MFLHVVKEAAQAVLWFRGLLGHAILLHTYTTSHAAHCTHSSRLLRETTLHHWVGASVRHHARLLSHRVLHHHLHHAHHAIHLVLHLLHLHRVLLRRHTTGLQAHLLHPLLHHHHLLLNHRHLLRILRLSRHAAHLAWCSWHRVHARHGARLRLSGSIRVLLLVLDKQGLERIWLAGGGRLLLLLLLVLEPAKTWLEALCSRLCLCWGAKVETCKKIASGLSLRLL